MRNKKWLIMIVAALSFLLITGCSSNDEADTNDGDDVEETENLQGADSLDKDEELTEQLEAEEGIESVMVQLEDGETDYVNVDIEVSEDNEQSGEEIADKFGEIIKETYPDRVVDMIIVKDGEIIEQTTIE